MEFAQEVYATIDRIIQFIFQDVLFISMSREAGFGFTLPYARFSSRFQRDKSDYLQSRRCLT
jgi:hypothetical protein